MRAGPLLGLLLALALMVDAGLFVQQTVTTTPAATVPVTLAAIGGVNTVLGASLTNASVGATTPLPLPILALPADALRIVRGSANWTVHLRISGASLSAGDSVTVSLFNGTSTGLTVTPATSLPTTSSPMTLSSTGSNLTVRAASGIPVLGGCGGLGSCTLTMQILLAPAAGGGPVISYPFTLRAT